MLKRPKTAVSHVSAALLIASAAGAAAQQTLPQRPLPAAPPPSPAISGDEVPQQTTATYGDWVLHCQLVAAPPSKEACDMAQVTQLQGKNVPFSRVAVAHPEKGQPVRLVVQVPVNVSFKTEMRLQTAENDPGVSAPFADCTPNGCFAVFDLNEAAVRRFHAATAAGKLSFADAGEREVTVPVSFKGFSEAFDALARK